MAARMDFEVIGESDDNLEIAEERRQAERHAPRKRRKQNSEQAQQGNKNKQRKLQRVKRSTSARQRAQHKEQQDTSDAAETHSSSSQRRWEDTPEDAPIVRAGGVGYCERTATPILYTSGQSNPRSKVVEEDVRFDLLDSVYAFADGYQIARDEKQRQRKQGVYRDGLTYGEVAPSSFATVLNWIRPVAGEHFVDLGSGTGKAVLTAAILHPFGAAIGVEIQQALHDVALQARSQLCQQLGPSLRTAAANVRCTAYASRPCQHNANTAEIPRVQIRV